MALRPPQDPYAAAAALVDKRLGTAFEQVHEVANELPILRYVAKNMEAIHAAATGSTIPGLEDLVNSKAPLDSPALEGVPTAPTPNEGTNSEQIATTAFVVGAVSGVAEDLASEVTARTAAVALKANSNSPALTGTPTAPTASSGTSTTQIATTAFTSAAIAEEAALRSQGDNAVAVEAASALAYAEQAYQTRVAGASVSNTGRLRLSLSNGTVFDAGSVVGPAGPVTIVGTPKGAWDADTNSPSLSDGSGVPGDAYVVSVAGTTSLDGINSWELGDTVLRGESGWKRVPSLGAQGVFSKITLPDGEIKTSDVDGFSIEDGFGSLLFAISNTGVVRIGTLEQILLAGDFSGPSYRIEEDAIGYTIEDQFRNIQLRVTAAGTEIGKLLVSGDGNVSKSLTVGEDLTVGGAVSAASISTPDFIIEGDDEPGFFILDGYRNVIAQINGQGVSSGFGGGISGGGGGDMVTVTATGTTTPLAFTDEHAILLHAKQFGAVGNGVANDTIELTALHDAAKARGNRFAYLTTGTYYAPSLSNVADVIFVGEGTITGAYRKRVIPRHAPTPPAPVSGVRPKIHLSQAAAAGSNVKVVFLGDSTTTINANQNAQSEYITPLIREKFMRDNPGISFNFVNLAIASTTFDDLDGIPGATPLGFVSGLWYGDSGKDWLEYAEDEAPDVIVFNFGMNYSPFTTSKFRSVMTKIAGWSKVPDLIFCTNKVSSLMISGHLEQTPQEGRDRVAHYQRTYAWKNGHGLIDMNRRFVLARDGFDILNQPIASLASSVVVSTGSYSFTSECHDFSLDFTLGNATTFWAAASSLEIQIGSRTGNTLVIDKDGGGNLAVTVRADTGIDSIARTVTSIPASTTVFKMFVKGGHLFLGSSGYITLLDALVERHGGLFTPRIRSLDGSGLVVATTFTLNSVGIGVPRLYMPLMTDAEAYSAGIYGGSDINHPSSISAALVDAPVIEATNLCISEA